ncbi:MAG TPA: UbiH/UbiF/VisC/COQ6 family ubiquinone biosynthesis hydroxylase [Gammaproteobacteria bacterium]|nr:UbiH/UbiF/VisC/COQ6 family ubiquinone biosynthesis hydroxylase [Gammaproteobacteria bacterium]
MIFSPVRYDIIIIGSGIVGGAAALALAKNSSLKIALLESQAISHNWQSTQYDFRVSAISPASKRIFEHISVWDSIQEKRVMPYTHMHVWDEGGSGKIDFDCSEVQEPALGYIIEDSVMRTSLFQKISDTPSIDFIYPLKLISLQKNSDSVQLTTEDGKIFSAKLLIAADGANSWARAQTNIEIKNRDYEQTAIVATVKTALPHQHTAWQRFLSTGPLAFLPLVNVNQCSIVWSAAHDDANDLLNLTDENFCERLSTAFEKKLGTIIETSKRYHFPLRMRHAKQYVQERVALIGDAAHTIHPLAGQGVNLGLLDAITLVETIQTAISKRRDFSSFAALRSYERQRKSETLLMLAGVDTLKQLFGNQNIFVKNLRNAGLDLTNRLGVIKNLLTNYALGVEK